MPYRLYWTEGATVRWSDDFEDDELDAGYTTRGAGWEIAQVDGSGVARSRNAVAAGYAELRRTVNLIRPGLVEFRLRLDVPDLTGGLPGRGRLRFLVDGDEAAVWVGSELWLPVRLAVAAGTRTLAWRFEDVDESGAWAAIDDLRVIQCAAIPSVFHVADYTPPRPFRSAVVHQPLQGPARIQAIAGGGTTVSLGVYVVGPEAYATLIRHLQRRLPLVWEDEGGRVYSGTAGPDLEVRQNGGLYSVRFDVIAQETAGVGAL